MAKFKYILSDCSGDVHTPQGKYCLTKELTQTDLAYLYNEIGMHNEISLVELKPDLKFEKPKKNK